MNLYIIYKLIIEFRNDLFIQNRLIKKFLYNELKKIEMNFIISLLHNCGSFYRCSSGQFDI
jgi:hypothetical protein